MDKERRKELLLKYKQMEIMMGVVKITNLVNGKVYVVSYPDLRDKWAHIQNALNNNTYSSGGLMRDWKLYGADAFRYEVLEQTPQQGETSQELRRKLDQMEKEWLKKLEPYEEKGYNRRSPW